MAAGCLQRLPRPLISKPWLHVSCCTLFISSFPPYTLSSAAGGLTLVWHTGQGSVTRPRVMEYGRCWRTGDRDTAVPSLSPLCQEETTHSGQWGQGSQDQKGAGRESRGAGHACALCQPLLIAEISIWECLDPRGRPRLSRQGGKGWRGCHGNLGVGGWGVGGQKGLLGGRLI